MCDRSGPVDRESRVDHAIEDLRHLTTVALAGEDRARQPFGIYAATEGDLLGQLAVHVERTVFEAEFGTDHNAHELGFSRFQAASLFFCAVDHRRALPVGAARVIVPSAAGLKTLCDITTEWRVSMDELTRPGGGVMNVGRTWDVATLAVVPDYRQGLVSQALHQAICTASYYAGVEWFVSILDRSVYRLLRWRLHRMFTPYAGLPPRMYAGSVSLPVWSDLVAYRQRLQRDDMPLYETLFLGRNLEPAVSTPNWHAVSALVRALTSRAGSADPAIPEPCSGPQPA